MAHPESDGADPDMRLLAEVATTHGMIDYLKSANIDLQAENPALKRRVAASDIEKADLQNELNEAKRQLDSLKEDRFQQWLHDEDGLSPPATVTQEANTSVDSPETPARESPTSIKREEESSALSSALSSLSQDPTSKSLTNTRSASRRVVSTGRRAPKRKDPDKFTNDPPPPYGRNRPKRIRTSFDYAEQEEESVSAVARDIWSKSQTPDAGLHDDGSFFVTGDEEGEEEDDRASRRSTSRTTASDLASKSAAAASQPKERYKSRPTHNNNPRWAVGTKVQIRFRFTSKGNTVLGIYEAWYDGDPEPDGNPPIAQLENQHGADWRNDRDRKNHSYANHWIAKRLKIIKGLEHFAQRQNKEPRALTREWDRVVQGRLTELDKCFPASSFFDQNKNQIKDPLVYFAYRPKTKTGRHPRI